MCNRIVLQSKCLGNIDIYLNSCTIMCIQIIAVQEEAVDRYLWWMAIWKIIEKCALQPLLATLNIRVAVGFIIGKRNIRNSTFYEVSMRQKVLYILIVHIGIVVKQRWSDTRHQTPRCPMHQLVMYWTYSSWLFVSIMWSFTSWRIPLGKNSVSIKLAFQPCSTPANWWVLRLSL